MKCDHCDNPASVHLTQVLNGKMQKLHLCDSCAQKMGVGQGATFSMSDLLLGQGVAEPLSRAGGQKSCRDCGWTLRKLKKTGRMGCPGCYDAFHDEIENVLASIHQKTRHYGRTPRHLAQKLSLRDMIETLEFKLSQEIAGEHYENAAAIRDELKKLQEKMQGELTSHDD
jgi:protein arginine kinase activator